MSEKESPMDEEQRVKREMNLADRRLKGALDVMKLANRGRERALAALADAEKDLEDARAFERVARKALENAQRPAGTSDHSAPAAPMPNALGLPPEPWHYDEPVDTTERRVTVIDLDTGEWVNGVIITGDEGARVAASVLPGTSPETVSRWYSAFMCSDGDDREALVKKLGDELEYRVRTAVALHRGGHDVEPEVSNGRAAVERIAADFRRPSPPTEEQIEAAKRAVWNSGAQYHSNMAMCEKYARAALEAAARVGGESRG